MSGHTPGPWTANAAAEVCPEGAGEDVYANAIALCDTYKRPIDECQANARLIAAAPEMLELLSGLLAEHEVSGYTQLPDGFEQQARALLERIDGEGDR